MKNQIKCLNAKIKLLTNKNTKGKEIDFLKFYTIASWPSPWTSSSPCCCGNGWFMFLLRSVSKTGHPTQPCVHRSRIILPQ